MIVIISDRYSSAVSWARVGRLPEQAYIILMNMTDCEKLLAVELTRRDTIARVGNAPEEAAYIEAFIKTRMR